MGLLFSQTCTNQTTSRLVRSWSTFGARTSHEQTRTHNIHHNPNLGEAATFSLILFSVHGHGTYTQMSFCPGIPKLGVPKFSKLGLPQLWRPITFCVNLQLRWGLKQICRPCLKFSNDMRQATWTQVNRGDSWLLTVGSQIGNWLPTLLLTITYYLSSQMNHVSPF